MSEYISDERIYSKEFMDHINSLTNEEKEAFIKEMKEKEREENERAKK